MNQGPKGFNSFDAAAPEKPTRDEVNNNNAKRFRFY